MHIRTLLSISLFTSILAPAVATAASCDIWLSKEFFSVSTPDEIQACLDAGRTLSERSDNGETPLHFAATAGSPESVLHLLRLGADVSLTTATGRTPLHSAAEQTDHSAVISYLLLWGSEIDKRIPPDTCRIGTCADSALHLAADRPDAAPILAALLLGGADPNSADAEGRKPLQRAVTSAGLAEVDVLLRGGAGVDEVDFDGNTALHVVTRNTLNELAIAERLIAAGADVDHQRDDDVTPLISAAYYTENPEVFALMMKHSEDPCHSSSTGTTALTGHAYNKALAQDEAYWKLHEQCPKQ
ncbi:MULTISPECIES: ankyrin repeat domain-containing protein [Mameliella]|uniref:ankyrin repeat domain-containing protein n=1 Tax=Mameliella sp. LZ-28 TaxID=2484146 RepID=UPI000B536198|nr:ankyrin repeat domain-containing protein [Mameliella sp. LZ-28]OWV62770.1 hypothetical protein CDZ98_00880 [Mameliella alba]